MTTKTEPRTRVVGVRMTEAEYTKLVALAERNGTKPTSLAHRLLAERMEELDA